MKVVQMMGATVYWITPYPSLLDAPPFAPNIVLMEAPDEVQEGWIYNGELKSFHAPTPPEPVEDLYQDLEMDVDHILNFSHTPPGGM